MKSLILTLIFVPILAQAGFLAKSCKWVAGILSPSAPQTSKYSRLRTLHRDLKFSHVSGLGLEILEGFSPKEYAYIGQGRSPFLVTDFIEKIFPGTTQTIPLTYNEGLHRAGMNPDFIKFLDKHFDLNKVKGKKLLLIDTAVSGRSLDYFYGDLKEYLKMKGLEIEVEVLFLHISMDSLHDRNGQVWFLKGLENLKQSSDEINMMDLSFGGEYRLLAELLFDHELKHFAPFKESAKPQLRTGFDVKPNKRMHDKYLKALAEDFDIYMRQSDSFRTRVEALVRRHQLE